MLFRSVCPGCGGPRGRGSVCQACVGPLRSRPPLDLVSLSASCGLDGLLALHYYDQPVRGLVLAAKNGGRRRLLRSWGRELAAAGHDPTGSGPPTVDVVTWVPAGRASARRRGYDQGRVLAAAVARSAGLPARRLLIRRSGPSRVGADRATRLSGPELRCPLAAPARVLVVDDVVTTGASLAAAAAALRRAGAESVSAAVVAVAGCDRERGLSPGDRPDEMN